jgi:hypothetical protein
MLWPPQDLNDDWKNDSLNPLRIKFFDCTGFSRFSNGQRAHLFFLYSLTLHSGSVITTAWNYGEPRNFFVVV